MREYILTVAGYRIRFGSVIGGPDLKPSPRFSNSISKGGEYDLFIRVCTGNPPEMAGLKRVFQAPLVEETEKGPSHRVESFWSVYSHRSGLLLKTIFPRRNENLQGALRYSLDTPEWELYVSDPVDCFDPFEYPLDGLILYYLSVMHGDIFIHGSAVMHQGKGYLFTGVSGSGKTTMAGLWEKEGARVIHDDRVIIRKTTEGYVMHNTPVYNDEEPRQAPLNHIFVIAHGIRNELAPMRGANALTRVMANCIQHNWSVDLISQLTGSLYLLTTTLPISGYRFLPDTTAVDYILTNA